MPRTELVKVTLGERHEVLVPARLTVSVKNMGPDPVFYGEDGTVAPVSHDGILHSGVTMNFTTGKVFSSAGKSRLHITVPTRLEQLEADMDSR
jgi:hypothetical protein